MQPSDWKIITETNDLTTRHTWKQSQQENNQHRNRKQKTILQKNYTWTTPRICYTLLKYWESNTLYIKHRKHDYDFKVCDETVQPRKNPDSFEDSVWHTLRYVWVSVFTSFPQVLRTWLLTYEWTHTHRETLYWDTNNHHHTDTWNLFLVLSSLILSPPGQKVQPRSENTFSALLNYRLWGCRDACPCCSLLPSLHLVFGQSNKTIVLWQHATYASSLLFRQPFLVQTFSPPPPMPASCGLLQTDCMLSKGHWVHSALALMSYLAHWWCNCTYPRQSRLVTLTNWVLAENSSIYPRGV